MIYWGFSVRHCAKGFLRSILIAVTGFLTTPASQCTCPCAAPLVHWTRASACDNTNSWSKCRWLLRLDHKRHHHFQHDLLSHLLPGKPGPCQADTQAALRWCPRGEEPAMWLGHVRSGPPAPVTPLSLPAEAPNITEHRSHHPGPILNGWPTEPMR